MKLQPAWTRLTWVAFFVSMGFNAIFLLLLITARPFDRAENTIPTKSANNNPRLDALGNKNKELAQQLEEKDRLLLKREQEIYRLRTFWIAGLDEQDQDATASKERKTDQREDAGVGTPAGNEFYYRNVSMRREESGSFRVIGEMANRSGRSYQTAIFVMSVYDQNGKLLDTNWRMIHDDIFVC